jgi:general secretion pathway protein C
MTALFKTENRGAYQSLEQASRTAIETALTVALGVLIGRMAWIALGPASGTIATASTTTLVAAETLGLGDFQTAAPVSNLTQANFFAARAAKAEVLSESTIALKLVGVRAVSGNTSASSAIVELPDGSQKRFVPGDEVVPGVVLVNVTGQDIHLSRDGALEALSLAPNRDTPQGGIIGPAPLQTAAAASVEPASGQDGVAPQTLVADTLLTPEFRGGEVSGYRLMPRGAGAFEAAGLEAGDLILRVNGQAVEGLGPTEISQSVASGSEVDLDIVRQGAIVRLRIAPDTYLSQ